jgi:hypothetical protein
MESIDACQHAQDLPRSPQDPGLPQEIGRRPAENAALASLTDNLADTGERLHLGRDEKTVSRRWGDRPVDNSDVDHFVAAVLRLGALK